MPICRHIELQDWWIEEIKLCNPFFKQEIFIEEYIEKGYVKAADKPEPVEVEVTNFIPKGYVLRSNKK